MEDIDDNALLDEQDSQHKEPLEAGNQKGRKKQKRKLKSSEPEKLPNQYDFDERGAMTDKGENYLLSVWLGWAVHLFPSLSSIHLALEA